MNITEICALLENDPAFDLFLHEGKYPLVRRQGQLEALCDQLLTPDHLNELRALCGSKEETKNEDTSYLSPHGTRFRVSLYHHEGRLGAVLRKLKTTVPTLEALGLPADLLREWISRKSGLILVTGPTGSGKSTTVAALLDWLNQTACRHIITVEDPVEYLFPEQHCLFSRREVGNDVGSYFEGVRQALRQSPDVIMLGEIRDAPTASTTLQACETGHMVVATLHSSTVVEAVERFTRLFNSEEREGVAMVLASQLVGILGQRLLPGTEGAYRLATEFLTNEGITRRYIQESRTKDLADLILREDNPMNRSLLRSLVSLIQQGLITEECATQQLSNPQDLQRAMRGISGGR